MIQKISNMLMLALVFLLPWQTRFILEQGMINGNQSEYLTLSVYGIDLLVVLSVAVKIFTSASSGGFKSTPTLLFQRRGLILGTLFVLLNALSIFWAADKLLAVQHVAWILLAAGLAWLAMTYEDKARLIFWFLMGLMVSAWLGIWQFFAQYAFANKWLGLAAHNVANPGTSYLEILDANHQMARWLRTYGSFDHPNIFGLAMTLGIILVLWLIYNGGNAKYKNAFLYLALASFSAGLYASLSRGAFLGVALGLGIILCRIGFSKIRKPLAVLLFVIGVFGLLYPGPLLSRSNVTARLEQKSLNERVVYLEQGVGMIKKHILLGVGAGNYIKELEKEDQSKPAWAYQPVHNFFLQVWAELGILAMLCVVVLFVMLGAYAWKKGAFQFAIFISVLLSMMVDHWLWSLHFGVLFLGFILGITLKYKRNKVEIS